MDVLESNFDFLDELDTEEDTGDNSSDSIMLTTKSIDGMESINTMTDSGIDYKDNLKDNESDYKDNVEGINDSDLSKYDSGNVMNVGDVLGELRNIIKDKYIEPIESSITYTSDSEMMQTKTIELSINDDSDSVISTSELKSPTTRSPVSPTSSLLSQPIIFKTSIKKDKGSKLQDQLVRELSTVLKKRSNVDRTTSVSTSDKKETPRKIGKILDKNKALVANLEKHFNRTLQARADKQRQSVHKLNNGSDYADLPSPIHLKHVTLNHDVKVIPGEIPPAPDIEFLNARLNLKTPRLNQNVSVYDAQPSKDEIGKMAASLKHVKVENIQTNIEREVQRVANIEKITKRVTNIEKEAIEKPTNADVLNSNKDKNVTIYSHRQDDGFLYSVYVESSVQQTADTSKHVSVINITGIYRDPPK